MSKASNGSNSSSIKTSVKYILVVDSIVLMTCPRLKDSDTGRVARRIKTYIIIFNRVPKVAQIRSSLRHETIPIFKPNIVFGLCLFLVGCCEIAIGYKSSGILPVSRIIGVFVPVIRKVDSRLWAGRAKKTHLPRRRSLTFVSKSKSSQFGKITVLSTNPY